ncbi:MAG: NAD(+) diphosphatase [Pseudomonadota bacterium]
MFKPTIATATALDRQSQRRSDNDFIDGLRKSADARFLILADYKPVILSNEDRTEAAIRWFTRDDLIGFGLPADDTIFLGTDRKTGAGHFALAATEHRVRNAPGALEVLRPIVDLRSLAMQGIAPSEDLSLMGQAKALAHWHDETRCCGSCGGSTEMRDGGWKRKCWACGREHFPRTDPVVIMAIVHPDGDHLLLGHEERFPDDMWSTLAGFLEPGEDIDHAVRRETFEESRIRVGDVRFHSAQPWPFPHSLMIGCHGFAETTDIEIDPEEIQAARWFDRDEVRSMLEGKHPDKQWVPGKQAIARALIQAWVDRDV